MVRVAAAPTCAGFGHIDARAGHAAAGITDGAIVGSRERRAAARMGLAATSRCSAQRSTPCESVVEVYLVVPCSAHPSASRLSPAALYRLFGPALGVPPKRPNEPRENVLAQEWRPEKRRLVALAIDSGPDQSFRHAFLDELFYCIRSCAYAEGIDLLVFTNVRVSSEAPFPPFLELCGEYLADGIVILSLPIEEPAVAAIAGSHFPCAAFDVDLLGDQVALVMSDNVGGGVGVVRHLIETGRRRIAFIGGSGNERPTVARLSGYQSELERWGLSRRADYVAMASWLPGAAYEATKRFLALPEPPDAMFCASDVMAIGAMAAIEEAGLCIPDDVAVVGFDDIDYASLVEPQLTTVHQSQARLAWALITAVLDRLGDPDRSPVVSVIPIELVVRESSAQARI
jgi:LacI family transcriptional regulator